MIKLTINKKVIKARKGETVLEIAQREGIYIPTLCYNEDLSIYGGCRLCLVEIHGQAGLHIACTRLAESGMVVRSNTDNIHALRKVTLELLLSEHNLSCTTCDKDGDCLLQDYAYEYRIEENRFPSVKIPPGGENYSTGDKAILYDPSKCIRCQRCVKICAEVQMVEALTLKGRSGDVQVTTGLEVELKESSCEMCGQCVSACPTGALYERAAVGQGKAKMCQGLAVFRAFVYKLGRGAFLRMEASMSLEGYMQHFFSLL